jgi:hypothetical protein
MHEYFVITDEQSNHVYEVHRFGCRFLSKIEYRISIGKFKNYTEALQEALKVDPNALECDSCSEFAMRYKNKKTKRIS